MTTPAIALARTALALAILAVCSAAQGQVYKCADAAGRTVYSDAPCDAGGKPLRLPDASNRGPVDPNVCTQIQDENRRLAAAADREAAQGRKESAASTRRRQSLNAEYAERCMGIARSAPATK